MKGKQTIGLIFVIMLVLSMGSVYAGQQNWDWLEKMLFDISQDIEDIKEKTMSTEEYLDGVLYPAIKQKEAILKEILEREDAVWNVLVDMGEEADGFYKELNDLSSELEDLEELNDYKQDVIGMKIEIGTWLERISLGVQPSLIKIHEEITELRMEVKDNSQAVRLVTGLENYMFDLDSDIINKRYIENDRYAMIEGVLNEIVEEMKSEKSVVKIKKTIKNDLESLKEYFEGDIKDIIKTVEVEMIEVQKLEVKEVNENLEGIKDYMQYVVYTEIDVIKQRLDELLEAELVSWNDLVYIKDKVDVGSKEIQSSKEAISLMDKEFVQELYLNEITVKQMDKQVLELLDEIKAGSVLKIEDFNSVIKEIKTKVQEMIQDTEEIGSSEEEIVESLSGLQNEIEEVELDLNSILRYSNSLFELLDCENVQSEMCDELVELNDASTGLDEKTIRLNEGKITIKNYIEYLEEASLEINNKVKIVENEFNCKTAVPNDVCFRLRLIGNYLSNLYDDSVEIKEYAGTLEDMKLDIKGKLEAVILDLNVIESEIIEIQQRINGLMYVTDKNYEVVNQNIEGVRLELKEITTSGIKLDFNTFLLLEGIIDLVDDSVLSMSNVKDYLEGKEAVEEITEKQPGEEEEKLIEEETVEEVIVEEETVEEETVEEVIVEEVVEEEVVEEEVVEEEVVEEEVVEEETVEEIIEDIIVEEIEEEPVIEEVIEKLTSKEIITALNENNLNLDAILQTWGENPIQTITGVLEENIGLIIGLNGAVDEYNQTEYQKYEGAQGIINSLKELTGMFENTAENNYNKVQEEVIIVKGSIKETLKLNNAILKAVNEYGDNDWIYDDIAKLIVNNSQLIDQALELNLSMINLDDKISSMQSSLELVNGQIDSLKQDWTEYTEKEIKAKLNIVRTIISYLGLNNSEELEGTAANAMEELEFSGKSTNVYSLIIELESELVYAENRVVIDSMTQYLDSESLEEKVTEESSKILQKINDNQIIIYELLNELDKYSSGELELILEENRDMLMELNSWIAEFNTVEENRNLESKQLLEKMLNLIGIDDTEENTRYDIALETLESIDLNIKDLEELVNGMLVEIDALEQDELYDGLTELLDEIAYVLGQSGMYVRADEIRLFKGKNYVTITMQPTNNSIESVLEDIDDKVKRVEYYDFAKQKWMIYNPEAPFGNNLDQIHAGKSYWIIMKGDAILTIN